MAPLLAALLPILMEKFMGKKKKAPDANSDASTSANLGMSSSLMDTNTFSKATSSTGWKPTTSMNSATNKRWGK